MHKGLLKKIENYISEWYHNNYKGNDRRGFAGSYILIVTRRRQQMKEISERRSIRKYKSNAVTKKDIETIIQAGILAPSAKNRQPWKYIIYTNTAKDDLLDVMEKGLLRERDGDKLLPKSQNCLPDAFHTLKVMREAPVLIIIENVYGQSPYIDIDPDNRITEICDTLSIGASVQNILLTATGLGYGTLWIANTCFAYKELIDFIGTKGQLVGAIALGIANESPNPRPRKAISEVLEFRMESTAENE